MATSINICDLAKKITCQYCYSRKNELMSNDNKNLPTRYKLNYTGYFNNKKILVTTIH